ncbi:hypothetical protein J7J41_02095 [bacterium]|nr:hypothetical protein [bacterium]
MRFPSTHKLLEVENIKDGILILKNGSLRQIIAVSGINLLLKSDEEQSMICHTFQDFLNSLDFSIQLIVHSREISLKKYLERLKKQEEKETSDLLKLQIREYVEFIKKLVEKGIFYQKSFFVVVPYDVPLIHRKSSIFSFLKFPFGKSNVSKKTELFSFEKKKNQLLQRVELVISGLERIGLANKILTTNEVIELLYNLYNPGIIEKTGLEILKKLEA